MSEAVQLVGPVADILGEVTQTLRVSHVPHEVANIHLLIFATGRPLEREREILAEE